MAAKTTKLSQERINKIAYALLIEHLSREAIQFDPNQFKRKLGNYVKKHQDMLSGKSKHSLPKHFSDINGEELQEALKVIGHDLVDYGFGFSFSLTSEKKKRK